MSDSLSNPKLLSISYSLQRNVAPQVSSIVSLMVSAASTEISERTLKATSRWGIASVGPVDQQQDGLSLLTTLNEALTLASIDDVSRSFYNSQGICISSNHESILVDTIDPTLSLIAQITDLKHFAQTKKQTNLIINEKTTSPELQVAQELLTQDTKPIDLKSLETTLDLDDNIPNVNINRGPNGGHLLLLASKPLESISPTILAHDLNPFESVTVLYQGSMDNILSWLRWSAQMGASLIINTKDAVQTLANRLQAVSRQVRRQGLHISASPGFSIVSMTQLTPQPGPIPFEVNERTAREMTCWINLPSSDQRWSMMINFKKISNAHTQPTLSFDEEGQTIATLHLDQMSQTITVPSQAFCSTEQRRAESKAQSSAFANPLNGVFVPRFDSNLRGIAFAQQLAHRVRVIDNLVLSLLRKELRKSAKLLDQLLRVTSTLQSVEEVEHLKLLKVKLLATGQLDESSKAEIINKMTQSTHQLSLDGYWIASKK